MKTAGKPAPLAIPSQFDELRVGYVPLTDCAPLIVAKEFGLFLKHGVRVRLMRELGWGTIRDKIVYGELDAAQAPGGLLFSLLAGSQAPAVDVRALMLLNLQGNAITLSKTLWHKGARDGPSLRQIIRSEAPRKPVFAVVAKYSTHHHLLRDWLKNAEIDPDKQVRMIVLPPPLVGEHLRAGQIDGFCAGEPWNSASVIQGDGWIAATSHDLAPMHPEKVMLAPASKIHERPNEFAALKDALLEACVWCDRSSNRPALAELLRRRVFPSLSLDVIGNTLVGPCDLGAGRFGVTSAFHVFHGKKDAVLTTPKQAMWLLDHLEASQVLHLTPAQRKQAVSAYLNDHSPAAHC